MEATKRTRTLKQPQSRSGCFTCRERKVKCDETQPSCQRCARSKRPCGGYKQDPERAGLVVIGDFTEVSRLSRVASLALHASAYRQHSRATSFWCFELPQSPASDDASLYAAAAFGAALEASCSPRNKCLAASRYYGKAVESVQHDLHQQSEPTLPQIAACLYLAFADVLMHRERHALAHLEGTLILIRLRQKNLSSLRMNAGHFSVDARDPLVLNDPLYYAAAALDILTSSYALGMDPRIPQLTLPPTEMSSAEPDTLQYVESSTLQILHAAFKFARTAAPWRYRPHSGRPEHLAAAQQFHISQLRKCISLLTALCSRVDSTHNSRALVLKVHSVSCLIYISAIAEPYERAYDDYESWFRGIIGDCKILLTRWNNQKDSSVVAFSPELGVVQPLDFTAIKCRQPSVRRTAIELMRQAPREGPFDARLLASVAQRAMFVEEVSLLRSPTGVISESIPEVQRIHGCGVDIVYDDDTDTFETIAHFSQCKNVEEMLADTSLLGYKDPRHWHIWQEPLIA